MLRNYVRIALRHFRHQKLYSLINLLGLSIGMTVCLLILLFVRDELSWDKHLQAGDRTCRVAIDFGQSDGSRSPGFTSLAPRFATYLPQEFPEIESVVRLFGPREWHVEHGEIRVNDDKVWLADTGVVDMFGLELIEGYPSTALLKRNDALISETMAEKLFGNNQALGKELLVDSDIPLVVAGVYKDMPRRSHIHMNLILPLEQLKYVAPDFYHNHFESDRFSDNVTPTYVRMRPGTDIAAMEKRLPAFVDRLIDAEKTKDGKTILASSHYLLKFQPVKSIHLRSHQRNEYEPGGEIELVYLFAFVAFLILLLACINYVNLATAQASLRAREVGMRKVIGARKTDLIGQFFGEALLMTLLSLFITLLLAKLLLPAYNNFLGRPLAIVWFGTESVIPLLAGLVLLVAVIACLYPAFYLSAFQPSVILRGELTRGSRGAFFRKSLVVFQYTISVLLAIGIGVVASQIHFIMHTDLGFDKENVITFRMSPELRETWENVESRFAALPGVISVTTTKRIPSTRLGDTPGFRAVVAGEMVHSNIYMPHVRVGYNFLDTYAIQLAAGRDFNREYTTDFEGAYIINETAVQKLGLPSPEEAINMPMKAYGYPEGRVIGVVQDFHYESLRERIVPMLIYLSPEVNTVSIRFSQGKLHEKISSVEALYREIHPGYSFDFQFLDEQVAQQYRDETNMMVLLEVFAPVAFLIAALGLIGLASFTAERRTREIGIRKTFGASVRSIVMLLTIDFIRLVIIGCLIALPLGWLAAKSWLTYYEYHIELHWLHFASALVAALLFSQVAVFGQALRAATKNPIHALRHD